MAIESVWQDPNMGRRSATPEQMSRSFASLSAWLWKLPWGRVGYDFSDGNSAAIGTTPTSLGLTISVPCIQGRLYKATTHVRVLAGAAQNVFLTVTQDGAGIETAAKTLASGAQDTFEFSIEFSANVTVSIDVTMNTSTGTATALAGGAFPNFLRIEDIGGI